MSALRKLLICPWFGPLPTWWRLYRISAARIACDGYDLLVVQDLNAFRQRVRDLLDVDCPITAGSSKIHDFRPAFGLLFAEELVGYDFWGHTDFDCVYGRVAQSMPDDRLAELDVFSDHTHYLCGPWALYRNDAYLAEVFRDCPKWRDRMEDPEPTGWVETDFTQTINKAGLRVLYELNHGYQYPGLLTADDDGRLLEDGREVSFFHFRRTKRWPLVQDAAA